MLKAAETGGAKAVVWSVDSPGSPDRQRAARYDVSSANTEFVKNTWEVYDVYKNATSLPIVLKGIQNVQDARLAVNHGVPAIILSNHGGRNLDGSPSSLEIALDIYNNDPDIFNQIEVLADGGVRYGTDALRLLALGVKAVSYTPKHSLISMLQESKFLTLLHNIRLDLDALSCSPTSLESMALRGLSI